MIDVRRRKNRATVAIIIGPTLQQLQPSSLWSVSHTCRGHPINFSSSLSDPDGDGSVTMTIRSLSDAALERGAAASRTRLEPAAIRKRIIIPPRDYVARYAVSQSVGPVLPLPVRHFVRMHDDEEWTTSEVEPHRVVNSLARVRVRYDVQCNNT